MSDDTTTYVETTTTTVEHTIPDVPEPPLMEVDPSMSQMILDRLDAMDRRLDEMAIPDVVIVDETTVEEPAEEPVTDAPVTDPVEEPGSPASEPVAPGETEPVESPDEEREDVVPAPGDTPPVVPDPDKPYGDRPEIENDPYTPDASAKKTRKRDRTPKTPRSWRTAILGGSGGIRTGGGNR